MILRKKNLLAGAVSVISALALLLSSCGGENAESGSGEDSKGGSRPTESTALSDDAGGGVFRDDATAEMLINIALGALPDRPQAQTYYSLNSDEGVKLDEYELSLLEDGTYEPCPEYGDLKDYAIYVSGGGSTFELQVLKADSESGAERLKEMLVRRIATISGGDKSMYDPSFSTMIENAEAYTDGTFAILMITGDNAAAKQALESLKN